MYGARSRLLSIPPGFGLLLGCILGAIQLLVNLYNESVYVTQATQIPPAFIFILWLSGYFFAGLLAGIYTKKERSGIIAGLRYLLLSTLADVLAPIILMYHRFPFAYPAPSPLTIVEETLLRSLPQELLMLGLAAGLGFLGSWLGSQRFFRDTSSTYMTPRQSTIDLAREQPQSRTMGIYIVLACAFIAFINRIIGFPLAHIIASRSYNSGLGYGNSTDMQAGITITCISLCEIFVLYVCTFIIAFPLGKQSMDRRTRSSTIFWMVLLGSIINIGTLIAFIYNDVFIYNLYGQPGNVLLDIGQPYLPYLFLAAVYLLVGAVGAVLLSRAGITIGIRKNGPQPKEDPLQPSSLRD